MFPNTSTGGFILDPCIQFYALKNAWEVEIPDNLHNLEECH